MILFNDNPLRISKNELSDFFNLLINSMISSFFGKQTNNIQTDYFLEYM